MFESCVWRAEKLFVNIWHFLYEWIHNTSKYTNHILDLDLIYIINKNAENIPEGKKHCDHKIKRSFENCFLVGFFSVFYT